MNAEVTRNWITDRATTLSHVLNAASVLLWMISIYFGKLSLEKGESIGYLGLLSILPPIFLVALSMLTLSFFVSLISRKQNGKILFFQTTLLIVFLALTPAIVEGAPRPTTTYQNYRAVDYISQYGNINSSAQWIHNWPCFSIFQNALVQISVIPEPVLLNSYATLYSIALLFPLFIFFRLIIHDIKLMWIAVWAFYVTNWVGQDYYSMQSLGFFIFVLMLFVLFKLMNSRSQLRSWSAILFLLFLCVVTSHMLSSLFFLSVLFVFFASKNFRSPLIVVIFALVFLLWNSYGAIVYLQGNLPRFLSDALRFDLIFQSNVASRIVGSPERAIAVNMRLVFSALVAFFALFGLLLAFKRPGKKSVEKRMLLALVGILCLLGFASYGGELFMRIFLFSLVPLCYFIYKGSNRKIFFCVFAAFLIVIGPTLTIIARYGNENMDYVPPSELAGIDFLYNVTTHGYVVLHPNRDYRFHPSYEYFALYYGYKPWVSLVEWKEDRIVLPIKSERPDWPRFVCIAYGTLHHYYFFMGNTFFVDETSKNLSMSIYYNEIYSNPNFNVYVELRG